jgi:hypothetical protein
MNCKLGDIAFIKNAVRKENLGLIVTCKENLGYFLKGDKIEISSELWEAVISDNYWLIESSSGSIETHYGNSKIAYAADTWLSPIRPEEIDKNILQEVDKPIEFVL